MSVSTIRVYRTLAEAQAGRTPAAAAHLEPNRAARRHAEKACKRVAAFLKGFTFRTGGANRYARSNTRRHAVEFHGRITYASNPLSAGNAKLDKAVLIFDLPAISSCGNCADCAAKCYAVKAQRQYPDVWNKRGLNLHMAVNCPDYLEALICAQLARSKKRYVRIHSAGDFFAQGYVDMWARIAARNAGKRFYFYTKMADAFDFSGLTGLPNVNMVESVLPDGSINFGTLEYIQEKAARFGAHICPYGIEDKAPVHCGGSCTLCMHARYVCFKEH